MQYPPYPSPDQKGTKGQKDKGTKAQRDKGTEEKKFNLTRNLSGLKKLLNFLGEKNHTISWDKTITQPLGTKKCRIRPTIDPLALV